MWRLERFLQALQVDRRDARLVAGVDLIALDPFVEGLRHAADLGGNRFNDSPYRGVLASVLLLPKRTARSRTSGENLFDFVMTQSSQREEPPQIRGDSLTSCMPTQRSSYEST